MPGRAVSRLKVRAIPRPPGRLCFAWQSCRRDGYQAAGDRCMVPDEARTRFFDRLEADGRPLAALTPAAGVEAMLAFYAEDRADGCDLEVDGDMLLFEWGTHDWGEGAAFEVTITRQLLVAGNEDDEPRQLSLRIRFDPSAALGGEDAGSDWCLSPSRLEAFRHSVMGSQVVQAVGGPPQDWWSRS